MDHKAQQEIQLREGIFAEKAAQDLFKQFISDNHDALQPIVSWGDGKCGYMRELLCIEFGINMLDSSQPSARKQKIPSRVRTTVFERDEYRCVHCKDHKDLCVDHIYPESLGGTLDLSNLQTLCRSCNSKKGNRV